MKGVAGFLPKEKKREKFQKGKEVCHQKKVSGKVNGNPRKEKQRTGGGGSKKRGDGEGAVNRGGKR